MIGQSPSGYGAAESTYSSRQRWLGISIMSLRANAVSAAIHYSFGLLRHFVPRKDMRFVVIASERSERGNLLFIWIASSLRSSQRHDIIIKICYNNSVIKHYFVYILFNKPNGTLYTGVTSDIIRRVYQHKSKVADGFTKRYGIDKLGYYEVFNDINSAISREKN